MRVELCSSWRSCDVAETDARSWRQLAERLNTKTITIPRSIANFKPILGTHRKSKWSVYSLTYTFHMTGQAVTCIVTNVYLWTIIGTDVREAKVPSSILPAISTWVKRLLSVTWLALYACTRTVYSPASLIITSRSRSPALGTYCTIVVDDEKNWPLMKVARTVWFSLLR